jgi:FAD/FMN-containing dehydrogenase
VTVPEWLNWSGSVRCEPRRIALPASEEEICALVREAAAERLTVRVAGTGHSFTPLVATDGLLLSLDAWTGVEAHAAAAGRATVRAGTKLHDLGEQLFALGLGMENLGDVDVQSVAGAVSTGTHGTGRALGNLSSHVVGMRLVTAAGEVVELSEGGDPDLLRAARVSLGALGVVSAVTLRVAPAYCLEERVWREPNGACLNRLAERIAENVRYEFFWFPATDEAECKTLNPTDLPPDDAVDLALGTPASAAPGAPRAPVERHRVGWSARVIPSIRQRKFNEMEYALPAEAGPDCFRLVRARMVERHPEVQWPVEYRTLAADDAWLSPAHGRETVTISIHQDARLPFREFFEDVEAVFRDHGGRPHWGKIHSLQARELRDLYPRWDDFLAARARLDPDGTLLNPHLRELFGLGA